MRSRTCTAHIAAEAAARPAAQPAPQPAPQPAAQLAAQLAAQVQKNQNEENAFNRFCDFAPHLLLRSDHLLLPASAIHAFALICKKCEALSHEYRQEILHDYKACKAIVAGVVGEALHWPSLGEPSALLASFGPDSEYQPLCVCGDSSPYALFQGTMFEKFFDLKNESYFVPDHLEPEQRYTSPAEFVQKMRVLNLPFKPNRRKHEPAVRAFFDFLDEMHHKLRVLHFFDEEEFRSAHSDSDSDASTLCHFSAVVLVIERPRWAMRLIIREQFVDPCGFWAGPVN